MKKAIVLGAALGLLITLSACGAKEEAAATPAAAGPAQEIKLVATNFKFDQAEYKVKKGSEVKIALDNKEGLHGIEIKGLNVKLEGQTLATSFTPAKAGTYEIICNVPCGAGHLTMKSKLVVE